MSGESEFDKIYRQTYLGELTDAEKKEKTSITVTCDKKQFTTTTEKNQTCLRE
jgi:hypothetical protein